MMIKSVYQLLPSFKHLEGTYSEYHKSTIVEVIPTFRDGNTATGAYQDYKRCGSLDGFPSHELDRDQHTIGAVLDNGDIVGVRSVIIGNKIHELMKFIDQIDDMNPRGRVLGITS